MDEQTHKATEAAHKDLMLLWERHKALQKQMLSLQADAAELDTAVGAVGKRIYDLYRTSDDGLNGDTDDHRPEH